MCRSRFTRCLGGSAAVNVCTPRREYSKLLYGRGKMLDVKFNIVPYRYSKDAHVVCSLPACSRMQEVLKPSYGVDRERGIGGRRGGCTYVRKYVQARCM